MQSPVAAVAADLFSDEPAAGQTGTLAAFAPLIGSWDLHFEYSRATGERIEGTGYAHFGWGLAGLAIVDIWGFQDGTVGTTIRFYDPKIDGFRSTWICPARNSLVSFVGRAIDGRIVLTAAANDPPGRRIRWSFVKIEAKQFDWTGEVSEDGTTWLMIQKIKGMRRIGEYVDTSHSARSEDGINT